MSFDAYKGIEVSGESVAGTLQGFRQFKSLATKFLIAEGLGAKGGDGFVQIDPSQWYPMDKWLSAFSNIAKEVGDAVLVQIGQGVMESITLPPGATGFDGVLKFINIGFHMHHRKNGVVMFDQKTGRMTDGIGTINTLENSPKKFVVEFSNPYPCAFDRGLIAGAAKRMGAKATLMHDEARGCRKNGSKSCTYVIYTQ